MGEFEMRQIVYNAVAKAAASNSRIRRFMVYANDRGFYLYLSTVQISKPLFITKLMLCETHAPAKVVETLLDRLVLDIIKEDNKYGHKQEAAPVSEEGSC